MPAKILVELPDGDKIFFGSLPKSGLSEVGFAEDVSRVAVEKFKTAMGSLAGLVKALDQTVGTLEHRPEKVELEFSVTLSAECDLIVVSGEGEAEFKVTLGWGKPE